MHRMSCSALIGALVCTSTVTNKSITTTPEKRPISVEDCVRTRRIQDQEVALSPDGARVAYVVKAPDTENNRNVYLLYLRTLKEVDSRDNGKVVLQADRISNIRWLSGGKLVARVEDSTKNLTRILIIDAANGSQESLDLPGPVDDYSMNSDGNVIVFSKRVKPDQKTISTEADAQRRRELYGYAVPFGDGEGSEVSWPTYQLYVARRDPTGRMDVRQLTFEGPGDTPRRSILRLTARLNLSPDGKYLLLTYSAETLPPGWEDEPLVKQLRTFGTLGYSIILGLYEIDTGKLRVGFNYPGFAMETKWAEDSQAYAVIAASPFASVESKKETAAAVASGNVFYYLYRFNHLFTVKVNTGVVTRVLDRDSGESGNPKFWRDTPLFWTQNSGSMLARADEMTFVWMKWVNQSWQETDRFGTGQRNLFQSSFSSDGKLIAGITQTPELPPDIFMLNFQTHELRVLTDLNPEFRNIAMGDVESITWTNRYGSKCHGHLIKPVGYVPGKRYPLVFLGADDSERFISDVDGGTTAYPPQSLASAGFAVVLSHYPRDNAIPQGIFPGQMRDAYNWMAMVEAVADLLAERGLADKTKIGIIGFSRTSWLTDFTISHSSYPFVAASSADGGLYNFAPYFNSNRRAQMESYEAQVGGPPYGETFSNWLNSAPAFNARIVRGAVLMEYTDPINTAFEFFVALNRQGKPAELYRYPKGKHPLDTPFERLASLRRNLDWFRFWIQGYEGKAPENDAEQYVRWRKLRAQQGWNERMRKQGKDPAVEYLRNTIP
jgi:dipeptidyl aminopeptidase/acylaminoacyl peptidase